MSGTTILYLSPHLDDVAFSASRHLITALRQGCRCIVATVFTKTVSDPGPFAIACQLDKGLTEDVDYMAMRRDEDHHFAKVLQDELQPTNAIEVLHGDLPEAPHRGYDNPQALFGEFSPADDVTGAVANRISGWIREFSPDLVLHPAGYGRHVDHRRVIEAISSVADSLKDGSIGFGVYRDSPYVTRNPDAKPVIDPQSVSYGRVLSSDNDNDLAARACEAYATQIPFQFGDARRLRQWFHQSPEWIADGHCLTLPSASTSNTAPETAR